MVSPLVSWRTPAAPPSLIVNTPIVIMLPLLLLPGGEFAHNSSNATARPKEPYGILVGQVFDFHLALHLTRQLARDEQQLPALGFVATEGIESKPAHTLVLAQNGVDDRVQLIKAKDDL